MRTDGHFQFRMPEVELPAYFARNLIFQFKISCIDCLICLSLFLFLSQQKSKKECVTPKKEDESPAKRDQRRTRAETQKALFQENRTKLMGLFLSLKMMFLLHYCVIVFVFVLHVCVCWPSSLVFPIGIGVCSFFPYVSILRHIFQASGRTPTSRDEEVTQAPNLAP